ncbi:MAG TPA: alpha/beta hydrolase [Terracidiphilus sp.]|nr:alpha/beta hydrolase [Terracidiphilus sp.]
MTQFLDLRYEPVGGGLAAQVNLNQGSSAADYTGMQPADLASSVRGRHVLIATHGYNVDRASGIASLSHWESLLRFSGPYAGSTAFLGLLWPGDSIWAHGLDYPDEPRIADEAGALLGPFIDANFRQAASVSFASHSLGARVVLSTIANMQLPVRRLTLMAGAIDDDCLNKEFQAAAAKIGKVSVLASRKDTVLSRIFPLGNFLAGILTAGHPWWRAAIGHCGPVQPWPANFEAPFEIPDAWNFEHGSYLEIDPPPVPVLPLPVDVPPQGAAIPANGIRGWPEAFTSAFQSTRFG